MRTVLLVILGAGVLAAVATIIWLLIGVGSARSVPGRATSPSCTQALAGTTYVVRITGPTARASCARQLRAAARSPFVDYTYTGTLAGRVLVCQGVEKDGNLHQIYAASKDDGLARLGCGALRADLRH